MITSMQRPGNDKRYLDLERRGLINRAQLTAIINGLANGWNNVNVSVQPQNR
jgi:hypothetical protein